MSQELANVVIDILTEAPPSSDKKELIKIEDTECRSFIMELKHAASDKLLGPPPSPPAIT